VVHTRTLTEDGIKQVRVKNFVPVHATKAYGWRRSRGLLIFSSAKDVVLWSTLSLADF
jgi:hypothetical protein